MQTPEQRKEWYQKCKNEGRWDSNCPDCGKSIRTRGNKSGKCLSCSQKKIKDEKWHEEKREKNRIKRAKYYANNKEKMKEHQRENGAKYKIDEEKRIESRKKYLSSEKGSIYSRINNHKRRMRLYESKAEGTFTLEEWQNLCNSTGNICLCCKLSKKLTIDHIIPLSKGGSNNITNIQPLCKSCNSKKRTKTISFAI